MKILLVLVMVIFSLNGFANVQDCDDLQNLTGIHKVKVGTHQILCTNGTEAKFLFSKMRVLTHVIEGTYKIIPLCKVEMYTGRLVALKQLENECEANYIHGLDAAELTGAPGVPAIQAANVVSYDGTTLVTHSKPPFDIFPAFTVERVF